MNLPVRGEVWLADCGMAAKTRLVLVPHTTTLIGSQFEASVPVRWLLKGAFNIQATFPLVPPKFIRKLGSLDTKQLEQIEIALRHWEGLG